MLSSPCDAAKHMEFAAVLAKELYTECGRSQPASDALAKGAHALEDVAPEEAIQLYTDACDALEEDGKEQMAFDLYRAATTDKCNATHSQCKAYLIAIIVYLYAHDFQQAEKCYNNCCQVEAFVNSDQNRAASRLLSAYTEGDVEEIKRAAQSRIISNLDYMIIKLARKLPTGDVSAFKMDANDQ
ncbi:Gamma-soluble NSF attachment protein [Forsythia ovata]|uniref:Gamma-soluble NSF attachment protein n=1 Tax=Forsythia ovata TaxID=205694 RepID=A0ABD1WUC4_9LAMI